MTVLIVDDDREDIELFTDALQAADPQVICCAATNGLDALKLITAMPVKPDMIFLDSNMPGLSGRQVMEEIQTDPILAAIPLVAWSTVWAPIKENHMKLLGADQCLTKPSSFTQLCDDVAELLKTHNCAA